MADWRPIDTAPREPVVSDGPLAFSRWMRLRDAANEAVGRWRAAVQGYDIAADANLGRDARWEGVDEKPLPFEPAEWAPHSSGMPGR